MGLVIETRHRIVGLRLQLRTGDASARERFEHRQASAIEQRMDQRGDEHGLARAGEAGDAEPHGGMDHMAGKIGERASGQPRLLGDRRERCGECKGTDRPSCHGGEIGRDSAVANVWPLDTRESTGAAAASAGSPCSIGVH